PLGHTGQRQGKHDPKPLPSQVARDSHNFSSTAAPKKHWQSWHGLRISTSGKARHLWLGQSSIALPPSRCVSIVTGMKIGDQFTIAFSYLAARDLLLQQQKSPRVR